MSFFTEADFKPWSWDEDNGTANYPSPRECADRANAKRDAELERMQAELKRSQPQPCKTCREERDAAKGELERLRAENARLEDVRRNFAHLRCGAEERCEGKDYPCVLDAGHSGDHIFSGHSTYTWRVAADLPKPGFVNWKLGCEMLKADNARLREALEYIAEMPNRIGIDADCESAPAKDCWRAARAALAGGTNAHKL